MAAPPDGIDLDRHREAHGGRVVWFRRLVVLTVVALLVAGLAGLLGQSPVTSMAAGPDATLTVEAPTKLRGGLFFQGRFTIETRARLEHTTLVLDEGWAEELSINTIEPAPTAEESRDGRLALDYGPLDPGETLVAYLQFQVNPTNVGRRSQGVALADGDRVIASVDRTVTVLP
jgi:hypothetical protein